MRRNDVGASLFRSNCLHETGGEEEVLPLLRRHKTGQLDVAYRISISKDAFRSAIDWQSVVDMDEY